MATKKKVIPISGGDEKRGQEILEDSTASLPEVETLNEVPAKARRSSARRPSAHRNQHDTIANIDKKVDEKVNEKLSNMQAGGPDGWGLVAEKGTKAAVAAITALSSKLNKFEIVMHFKQVYQSVVGIEVRLGGWGGGSEPKDEAVPTKETTRAKDTMQCRNLAASLPYLTSRILSALRFARS
jgi:hypothetical protein